jgi:hypothetical protein
MKSIMGFLILLFSATTALADDYQIFPLFAQLGSTSGAPTFNYVAYI